MSVITDYQTKTDPEKVLFYNIDQLVVIRICSSKIRLVPQLLPAAYYVFNSHRLRRTAHGSEAGRYGDCYTLIMKRQVWPLLGYRSHFYLTGG